MTRPYDRAWRRTAVRVLWRDRHRCHWCGGRADSVDHVVPLKLGGSRLDPANLVACCTKCNSSRGGALAQALHPTAPRRGPQRWTHYGALKPDDLR